MMRKFLRYFFITVIGVFFLPNITMAQTPSIPGDWETIPMLSDEFEYSLDYDKWQTQDPKWDGRFPSYFEQKNTKSKNGNLLLISRDVDGQDSPPYSSEGTYTHAAAVLKSTTMVKYGYFETESKSSGSKWWWNSFWLYDYIEGEHKEIDIFEVVGSENYIVTNYLVFESVKHGIPTDDRVSIYKDAFTHNDAENYHVYALDWNKDSVTTYIDGVPFQSVKNEYWHQEMYLVFSTQINPEWPGVPEATSKIDSFNIKYIRSWRKAGSSSTINKTINSKSSTIYPNPSAGLFNLNFSSTYNGEVNIKVFTADGRQIRNWGLLKEKTKFEYQIDLSNHALGVYLVQIVAGEYRSNHRLIVK